MVTREVLNQMFLFILYLSKTSDQFANGKRTYITDAAGVYDLWFMVTELNYPHYIVQTLHGIDVTNKLTGGQKSLQTWTESLSG